MYRFNIASKENMEQISNIRTFDLDLDKRPRFFAMTEDSDLLSFVLVYNFNGSNYIEYIYENNLNSDEIDFFYRALVYMLGEENDLFSSYKHKNYVKEADNGYYKVIIPKGRKCGS